MILQGVTQRSSRCCVSRAVSQVGMAVLTEPMQALEELRCIPKPERVIGLRDADGDGEVYYMAHDDLEWFSKLTGRVIQYHGGDIRFGRKEGRLLREAGFQNVIASASSDAFGTTELTAGFNQFR